MLRNPKDYSRAFKTHVINVNNHLTIDKAKQQDRIDQRVVFIRQRQT